MITRKEIVEALAKAFGPEETGIVPPADIEDMAPWVAVEMEDGHKSLMVASIADIADIIAKLMNPPERSILGPNEILGEEGLPHRYSASCTHCVFWVMADTEAAAISTYESHSCAEVNERAPE